MARCRNPIGFRGRMGKNMLPMRGRTSTVAYSAFLRGLGGNQLAPLAARGDNDPSDATSIAGAFNKRPRQPILPNRLCNNGDMLFFYQGMDDNVNDFAVHSILMLRSSDKGTTWTGPTTVYRLTASTTPVFTKSVNFLYTGGAAIDAATGRVHFVYTLVTGATAGTPPNNAAVTVWHTYSDDHGVTWSAPVNISASAKKQAGSSAAPWDANTVEWGWYIVGPGAGIQLQYGAAAGRIMFGCGHRYTADNSGVSYAHMLYTDNNGTSWNIAGPLESANGGPIEPAIVEYGTAGEVYFQSRQSSGSYRLANKSTAGGGTTWGTNVIQDGTGGTTALSATTCQGSLTRTSDGTLYACFPSDSGGRFHGRIWKSTNDATNWQASRCLHPGPFGYSSMLAVDAASLFVAYEGSINYYDSAQDNVGWYEYLLPARVPTSWVTNTPAAPNYSHWLFNESTSGAFFPYGNPIKDHGDQRADGRANVANVAIAGGTYTATGFTTSGSALAAILCEKQASGVRGNATDMMDESMTIEIPDFTMAANASTRVILDNRNNTTQPGWTIKADSSNRIVFEVRDAAGTPNTCTATTTAAVADGTPHDIRCERNATTHQCSIYIDGTLANTASDTPGNTGSIMGTYGLALGGKWNNTTAGAGNYAAFSASEIRITHGILTTGFLTGSETKETLNSYIGYTAPTPVGTTPAQISGCRSWLFATSDNFRQAGCDLYGATDKREWPPRNGSGVSSYVDPITGRLWQFGGALVSSRMGPSRGVWVANSTAVGKHYRVSFQTNTGYPLLRTINGATDYDFMFLSGNPWTMTMAIRWHSGSTAAIWSQNDNSNTNAGFYIQRSAGTGFDARLSQTATLVSNSSFTKATSNGTWYFIAFVNPGGTTRPTMYVAPYTTAPSSPSIGTVITTASTAPVTPGIGTASTTDIAIGAKLADNTGGDFSIKNLTVHDTALNTTNLQLLCDFNSAN